MTTTIKKISDVEVEETTTLTKTINVDRIRHLKAKAEKAIEGYNIIIAEAEKK